MYDFLKKLGFLISLGGTLGSLYFSEVLKFPPCTLCWYQRICLYPLVFIFGTSIWFDDQEYAKYALPFSIVGIFIAAYHNLIYYGVIPEALSPCTREISCSAKQLELFGVITIPLLAFLSFALLSILIVWSHRLARRARE